MNRLKIHFGGYILLVAAVIAAIFGHDKYMDFVSSALGSAAVTLIVFANIKPKKTPFRILVYVMVWLYPISLIVFPEDKPLQTFLSNMYFASWMIYVLFGNDDGKPGKRRSIKQIIKDFVPVAQRMEPVKT